MSMWHNVKYGWSGQIRANFSKEQPVWLLGRCYHPKFSPTSSMESSAEMTASLEHKLTIGGSNENAPATNTRTPPLQLRQSLAVVALAATADRPNPVLMAPVVVMDPIPPMTAAAAAAAAESTQQAHIVTGS